MTVMELNSSTNGTKNMNKSESNNNNSSGVLSTKSEIYRPPTDQQTQVNNNINSGSSSRKNSASTGGYMPAASNLSLSSTASSGSSSMPAYSPTNKSPPPIGSVVSQQGSRKHSLTNTNVTSSQFASSTSSGPNSPTGIKSMISEENKTLEEELEKRRASGNSITIRITNTETNNNEEYELATTTADEEYDNEHYEDNDDLDLVRDRDQCEDDTSSNSLSHEFTLHTQGSEKQPKKKLKERKKLVRSLAQQQHHLTYQESEDQVEEDVQTRRPPHSPSGLVVVTPTSNHNRAFDELFAAAQNPAMSAIIEAKLAAQQAAEALVKHLPESNQPPSKRNSISRGSRNGSFRRNASNNSSVRRAGSRTPNESVDSKTTLNVTGIEYNNHNNNSSSQINANGSTKRFANNLNIENNVYLGANNANNFLLEAPQALTRSVSCKRPSSFKRMRSKNASPNPSPVMPHRSVLTPGGHETGQELLSMAGDDAFHILSSRGIASRSNTVVTRGSNANNSSSGGSNSNSNTNNNVVISGNGSRRGTHCSVTMVEELKNRAGSLPFENMTNSQNPMYLQLTTPNDETYRVRQFNTTHNGSVINRGDSFKRSFKKSNQSISSSSGKNPPLTPNLSLAIPSAQSGFISKSANNSSYAINETSFSEPPILDDELISPDGVAVATAEEVVSSSTRRITPPALLVQPQESVRSYLVYMIGATSVGKNALIKQFKTSEYRGTYVLDTNQSNTDEDPEEGVSVMMDGVESRLQFVSLDIELAGVPGLGEIVRDSEAFIIVYSISDKSSFQVAAEILKQIRSNFADHRHDAFLNSKHSTKTNLPCILVGNKSDLVRKRSVSREEGRNLAFRHGAKFIETSVAINDRVDDLLAGTLKQIRLKEALDKDISASLFNSGMKKQHSRTFSDAHLHDLFKRSSMSPATTGAAAGQIVNASFATRTGTLTRKLFKFAKNKDNGSAGATGANSTALVGVGGVGEKLKTNNLKNELANGGVGSINNYSFFSKLFNTIFKKKSTQSNLQSVENLFTLPINLTPKMKK